MGRGRLGEERMVISHFRPPLCKMPPKDDIVAVSVETHSDGEKSTQNTDTPPPSPKGTSSDSDLIKRWERRRLLKRSGH